MTATFFRTAPDLDAIPVLLKFSLPSERQDSVVAEATALTLGRGLGLDVPVHEVVDIAGRPALSIARFDRGPGMPGPVFQGPVFHCVSAATALGLPPAHDREDRRRSYVALRSKLTEPGDGFELFQRIVLNAAVGNTDDHPWNTSLGQAGLGRWKLAPLYDVLPFFNRNGTPVFCMAITRENDRAGTHRNLVRAGRQIAGLRTDEEIVAVIERVAAHVRAEWRPVFEAHAGRVSGADPDAWKPVFEPDQGL